MSYHAFAAAVVAAAVLGSHTNAAAQSYPERSVRMIGSPDKLEAFLKGEIAKWAEVAKSASLMPR